MKNKKRHVNPFWGPSVKAKGLSSFGFKPIKLNTSSNIGNIPKRNLTWAQASIRYPKMQAFGDADRDGKLNMFDCKPFNKRRHSKTSTRYSYLLEGEDVQPKRKAHSYLNADKFGYFEGTDKDDNRPLGKVKLGTDTPEDN